MCKLRISDRIWARKLVRWFGFLIHPNYAIEDIEISSCPGMVEYDKNKAIIFRVINEDNLHYYVLTEEGVPAVLTKESANRHNTVITGKVYYEKTIQGCYFVDSENDWEKRLEASRNRVKGKGY